MPSKAKMYLFLSIFGFVVLTPVILFFFTPELLVNLLYVVSYFFLIVLMVKLTSSSLSHRSYSLSCQRKLPSSPKQSQGASLTWHDTGKWFLKILLGQIIFIFLFYSFLHTATHYIPYVSVLGKLNSSETIFNLFVSKFALHPWPLIAILSAGLSYAYYQKKQLPILSSLLPRIKDEKINLFIKRTMHILLNAAVSYSVILTLSFGVLAYAKFITEIFGFKVNYGLNFSVLFFAMIIMGIFFSPQFEASLNYLKKNMSLGKLFSIAFIVLIFLITLLNLTTPILNVLFSKIINSNNNLALAQLRLTESEWKIMLWAWWVGWIPLVVSYLAKISDKHSVAKIIFAIMFLPVVLALFEFLNINFLHISINNHLLNLFDLAVLLSPILVIALFWKSYKSDYFLVGFMPDVDGNIYAKPRRLSYFVKNLLQGMAAIVLVYLLTGLKIISVSVMIIAFLCLPWFIFISAMNIRQ